MTPDLPPGVNLAAFFGMSTIDQLEAEISRLPRKT